MAEVTNAERDAPAYKRHHREKRKRLGLCRQCTQPARPGASTCADCFARFAKQTTKYYQEHKEQYAASAQRRYRRRLEAGLCVSCSNPRLTGLSMCSAHLARCREKGKKGYAKQSPLTRLTNLAINNRRRQVNKANGLCERCPERLNPGSKSFCLFHLLDKRAADRRRYAAQ